MAWGNMEVESVEIVQDMSYEVLREKAYEKFRTAGFLGAYREIISDFDIAVMSLNKCKGNKWSVILQCEDSLNILISLLFVSLDILESCLGYSILKSSLLEVIECIVQNKGVEDKIRFCEACEKLILEEIDNLKFWGDKESLKKAEQLSYYVGSGEVEPIFKVFIDDVEELIKMADKTISHYYGCCDEKKVYFAVNKAISYYACEMRKGKEHFSSMEKIIINNITSKLDYYYNVDKINHPFISVMSEMEK